MDSCMQASRYRKPSLVLEMLQRLGLQLGCHDSLHAMQLGGDWRLAILWTMACQICQL
jgi:hypothetical protein